MPSMDERERWLQAREARRAALAADPDAAAAARSRLADRVADDWDEPILVRPEHQTSSERD